MSIWKDPKELPYRTNTWDTDIIYIVKTTNHNGDYDIRECFMRGNKLLSPCKLHESMEDGLHFETYGSIDIEDVVSWTLKEDLIKQAGDE